MATTMSNYEMVETAILTNVSAIKNDFTMLHIRQKGMINQLENDFLQAIPDKIKSMSVAEFLQKYDGDINRAFCSLYTADLNTSQSLSNASTLPLQPLTNFQSKDRLLTHQTQFNNFIDNMPKHMNNQNQNLTTNNKGILKNSKRKRNEYEQDQKKLLNNLYQQSQQSFTNNKENFQSQQNAMSQTHGSQSSKQNSSKKNNIQSHNYQQSTTTKSGKKIWRF